MSTEQQLQLTVSTQGPVSPPSRQRAEEKLEHLTTMFRDPVLFAEVRLVVDEATVGVRPAIAEATLDINGTPIRAQVAAADIDAAVDLLEERLKRRIVRHEERLHRTGKGRHRDSDHEWRHGDLPSQRPEWYERDVEDREVIRHKTFALEPMTVDEAAFDLDALAHDFYLFTELHTGSDAIVAYDDQHGLVLQMPEGVDATKALTGIVAPVRVLPPAPRLSLADAEEGLDLSGAKWLFCTDDETDRGHVVYHRFDGHYGVITPAR